MPQLRDVELFKSSVLSLGNEPEKLQAWGEAYEEPQPPPQSGKAAAARPGTSEPARAPGADAGLPPASTEELASLLDLGPGPGPADDGLPGEASAPADDFSSFLGGLSFDDLPSPPADESERPDDGFLSPEPSAFDMPDFDASPDEGADAGAAADDEGLTPDSLLAGLMDEVEEAERAEGPAGDPVPEEAVPEASGFDDFSIPEELDAEEAVEEPPADSGTEPESGTGSALDVSGDFSLDNFSLPDDGGFPSFDAPAETGSDGMVPGMESREESPAIPESFEIGELAGETPLPGASSFETSLGERGEDAFDHFDLGGEGGLPDLGAIVPEMDAGDFSAGTSELDGQLASLEGDAPIAETFSLDSGWGADFTIPGFETAATPQPKAAQSPAPSKAPRPGSAPPRDRAETEAVRPVSLTDAQVDALQDTLLSYPLNVRLAVEDAIANAKGSEAQQSALVWMLVERAPAKDAAKLAGRMLKRYIEVPPGFEKRTGAAFEAEKGSLAYIFRHSVLPILQIVALVAAGLGVVYFLGKNYVYDPLHANSLYAQGYRQIEAEKYAESMDFFDRADRIWTFKRWYYRYAAKYAEMGQYPRSEAMYDRLLESWPKETKAALLYARMESGTLYAFERAESILKRYVLERDYFNKEALLLMADNYLAWADMEEQRRVPPSRDELAARYENARYYLAMIMEKHGRADAYLERMLLYFIRVERALGVDKLKEILPLAKYFIDSDGRSRFSASTLAEAAQYLMDRDEVEHVGAMLIEAVNRDGALPEAHVAMARWSRRTGFMDDERQALLYAVRFYEEADQRTGLVTKRLKGYLSTLIRLSEVHIAAGESLDAEAALATAIKRYERGLEELRYNRTAEFGKAYSLLAGIYYLERRDFPQSLQLYAEAERNGFTLPETDYRRGYMWYYDGAADGTAALQFFYRAALDAEPSPYLLLAIGDALYARSDYFAAQGYFTMLVDRMQFELDTLSVPAPQVKPTHGEIVELLIMARNNLGATLTRIADRIGDSRRRSEAMVQFTESARLYDSLSRDQTTMIRSESRNLGFLNLDFVLHPLRGMDIVTYRALPVDMEFPRRSGG